MNKVKFKKNHNDQPMMQIFGKNYAEVFYATLGLNGLQAEIEFPSDWHEHQRAWIHFGFGFGSFAFSFPWHKVVPDNYQCSGPRYGFTFFERGVHLHYGKDKIKIVYMPYHWEHVRHQVRNAEGDLIEPMYDWELDQKHGIGDDRLIETYPYKYTLKSGKVQDRMASIYFEEREWRWKWFQWSPWPRLIRRSINIDFDSEVGEQSGSWKGGVLSCSYDALPNETMKDTLKRMEKERKF